MRLILPVCVLLQFLAPFKCQETLTTKTEASSLPIDGSSGSSVIPNENITANGSKNCFSLRMLDKAFTAYLLQVFNPLAESCREVNKSYSKPEALKCAVQKFTAAADECEQGIATETKTEVDKFERTFICARKKLLMDSDIIFEDYKTSIVDLAAEDKKEAIGIAISACESSIEWWICTLRQLTRGPCPELKTFFKRPDLRKKK